MTGRFVPVPLATLLVGCAANVPPARCDPAQRPDSDVHYFAPCHGSEAQLFVEAEPGHALKTGQELYTELDVRAS
jgi:hypothetical protein